MTGRATGKVRWGVLGVAKIALEKVIPAMQRGAWTEVTAIASRDLGRARAAGAALGIPTACGSYEDVLADPMVEAVYIPLPNHLHVPWAIRAVEAGKHVLCEKPIGLNAAEAARLLAVRDAAGVLVQEAFMIRAHPQWLRTLEIVRSGRIGPVRLVAGLFHYFNVDPTNIRNIAALGGGGLMDIGCYLVHAARWVFDREPDRVLGLVERDPVSGVDRLASILLDFGAGQAVCTCGTQGVPYQRVTIFGTRGRVEIEIPFNTPADRPCRIFVNDEAVAFDVCDQYTRQADAFSQAVRGHAPLALPLEDSVANMRAIDAVVRSAASGRWEWPHADRD